MPSLSMRTARASGCLRIVSMTAARPTAMPACGPPSSLSPLNVTTWAPAAMLWLTPGSSANTSSEPRAPLPRSSIMAAPRSAASRANSVTLGSVVNPTMRKLLVCTRSTARVRSVHACSKSRRYVRFVVPTSTSSAPLSRRMSGMRNPSPISTSCPRLTSTSPPRAVAASARSTAAALLLTTRASSAPVSMQRMSCTWSWREPRAPLARSISMSV